MYCNVQLITVLYVFSSSLTVEADPQKFSIGFLEGPFRIGMPFQVPLEFQDAFGHVTKPDPQLTPQLEARCVVHLFCLDVYIGNSKFIIS